MAKIKPRPVSPGQGFCFWPRGQDSNRRPPGYEHASFVSGRLVSPVSKTVIPDRRRICYLVPSALSGRALCLSPRFVKIGVFGSPLAVFASSRQKRTARWLILQTRRTPGPMGPKRPTRHHGMRGFAVCVQVVHRRGRPSELHLGPLLYKSQLGDCRFADG